MKTFKRFLASLMVAVMVLSAAPLSGFVGLELPSLSELVSTKASAEENTSGVYKSGDGWTMYNDGELVITKNLEVEYFVSGTDTSISSDDRYNFSWPWTGAFYTGPWGEDYYTYGYTDGSGSHWFYGDLTNRPEFSFVTKVTVVEGVTSIGELMFVHMVNLKSVTIPETVTFIGGGAFYGCTSLETVDVKSGMVSLLSFGSVSPFYAAGMFEDCSSLKTLSVNACVTEIGNSCFSNCTSLSRIDYDEDVVISKIGYEAFYNCSSLENFDFNGNYTSLGKSTFENCTKLKEIELPETLTSVGSYAFKSTGITHIEIPGGVSELSYVFSNCINLESVVLNEGTVKLNQTFSQCVRLKYITVPTSLTTVTKDSFAECVSLELVIYPGAEDYWNQIDVVTTGNEYFIAANRFYNHWHDEHTVTYLKNFVQVTCESSGYTGDLRCKHCDWLFSMGEYQEALGHNYQETVVDATCTGNGYKYTICQNCGKSSLDGVYPATGHTYNSKVVKPDCTDGGYTLNVCSKCGLSTITNETEPLGHSYVSTVIEATCTRDGYTLHKCTACNASYIDGENSAFGHTYVDTEVKSTCTGVGYTTHKCSTCGDEYVTNETPAKGHSYEPVVISPSCTSAGYTIYICSDCGLAYKGDDVQAAGHKYKKIVVAPTCLQGGHTLFECSVCGDSYIGEETQATGHSYKETVVAPTCENDGYTRHECEACHDCYDTDVVSATGHTLKSAVVEATCTTDGFTISSCTACGYSVITNETLAFGHDYQPSIVIQHTCIQDGCTINICSHCRGVSKTEGKPATGHTFSDWSVTEEATEEHEGLEQRVCRDCGYTEDKLISIVERTTFYVTFKADGKVVAVVEYLKGAESIPEPPVPHKDRFEGRWSDYDLNDSDITVEAIYEVIDLDDLDGIEHGKSAVYDPISGVATINLFAASEAKTIISKTSKKVPLDIVLVVDQSGSMDDKLGGSTTKKQALINSATSFVDLVYNDASQNGVDHRIAIVGFGMGNKASGVGYPAYLNTEILTTGGNPIQMNSATSADYANALMPVYISGGLNTDITRAINSIDAKGATAADCGLSMANNVFANNTDNDGRERIVVFMTDGAPTYASSFSKDVANAAILHADELKNTYGANIYSVGVMDKAESNDSNIDKFMNYVSSNYEDAKNLNGKYEKSSSEFYISVNNTNALSGIFEEIVIENITRTTDFDDITLIDTVSKYFTMTSQQEKALRVKLIETYGINNSDIEITRNEDGTTMLVVEHIHPIDNGEKFVVDISFEVSADEDALAAGVYPTNTEDAGIIIGDVEDYECVFVAPYITIPVNRATAVFSVNGVVYSISTVQPDGKIEAPEVDFIGEYEFSGWDLTTDSIEDGCAHFDATYVTQEYVVVWNTADGTVKEYYNPDDVINVPNVCKNSNGDSFRRWNGEVPVTMPAKSIEFTAVYGDHEHKYEVQTVTEMTCLTDGMVKYTCSICGDSYNETVPCYGEHSWKVVASVAGDETGYETLECENCGISEERKLEYTYVDEGENERGYKEFVTHSFNLVDEEGNKYQPDGIIDISMPVDEHYGELHDMEVYRVDENGNRIECNSEYDNGIITFEADHFSTYIFVPVHTCSVYNNHADVDGDGYCDRCDNVLRDFIDFVIKEGIDAQIDSENNLLLGNDILTFSTESISGLFEFGNIFVEEKETGKIGTGDVICLTNDSGEVCNKLTAVIFGDVNGDGWYDGQDAIIVDCLANGMLTKDDVSEAVYMAADCNHDGVIDQLDVDLLNEAGTLLANVDQSKPAEVLLETSSEYVEYLSLIDQSFEIETEEETEDIPEADAEETPETDNDVDSEDITPEQDTKVDVFEMIMNFIKSIIEMILSRIPVPYK